MTDEIRYPDLRRDVADAVEALADGELAPEGGLTWDMVVHALYDDAQLGEGAADAIGDVLRDEREAEAMDGLIKAVEAVFADVGVEAPIERVLDAPGWPKVVDAAREARELLRD